jgi:hypothetical protein
MFNKIFTFSLILLTCLCLQAPAQEIGTEQQKQEEGHTGRPFILKIKPRIIGCDIQFGLKKFSIIKGLDTILWFESGISWKKAPFYRDVNDELLTSNNLGNFDRKDDIKYGCLDINWGLGITQGIIWNNKSNRNLLEVSLFYRGRYDKHFEDDDEDQIIFNQNQDLPDMDGIQQNSFVTGLALNFLIKDKKTLVIKGFYSEASLEWGPPFLNRTADFMRLNFSMKGFIPLFSIPTKISSFSLYLGNYTVLDWIYGDGVPVNVRQSIGGLYSQHIALGGKVIRGIDTGSYDACFKLANCTELRMVLPLKIPPGFVPGLIYYFDSAYYNQLKGTDGGFLFTTGFGLFIDILGKFQVTFYTGFFLNGENVDDKKWKPFIFAFKYHF